MSRGKRWVFLDLFVHAPGEHHDIVGKHIGACRGELGLQLYYVGWAYRAIVVHIVQVKAQLPLNRVLLEDPVLNEFDVFV